MGWHMEDDRKEFKGRPRKIKPARTALIGKSRGDEWSTFLDGMRLFLSERSVSREDGAGDAGFSRLPKRSRGAFRRAAFSTAAGSALRSL
jgi:hypothetical protein